VENPISQGATGTSPVPACWYIAKFEDITVVVERRKSMEVSIDRTAWPVSVAGFQRCETERTLPSAAKLKDALPPGPQAEKFCSPTVKLRLTKAWDRYALGGVGSVPFL
jgi:hypothetical protein